MITQKKQITRSQSEKHKSDIDDKDSSLFSILVRVLIVNILDDLVYWDVRNFLPITYTSSDKLR